MEERPSFWATDDVVSVCAVPLGNSVLVSVIIPSFNEGDFIRPCLESILANDFPQNSLEVLIVDGMSRDGTRGFIQDYSRRYPFIQLLDNPKRIVPTALNIGIRAARGEWIIRLDAHSEYPRDYIRLCLETSQRTGADNVGGIVMATNKDDSKMTKLVQAVTTHQFGVGNSAFRVNTRQGPADTVPFGCYRRTIFDQIGWFDERLVRNQDYEFNRRLLWVGGRIWLNKDIKVFYHNHRSFCGLLRQAVHTGQWNPWMWYVAPYAFALRHAIPGLFVLVWTSALGLSPFTWWGRILVLTISILYLAQLAFASCQQANRHGWWTIIVLPFLFPAYHFAYGAGTLWGIFLLLIGKSSVQREDEPWPGAGHPSACTGSQDMPGR